MKKIFFLLLFVLGINSVFSQNKSNTEYTGGNFSLEGALAMFKKANSPKNFEKLINEKNNNVNNLDLNDDSEIDFINVDEIKKGDIHIIVLSTYLNETERQDIATISIEKTGEAIAIIQIEGNSDLYPENTIIEPTEEKESFQDSKGGPNSNVVKIKSQNVNVWFWACVHYIYSPRYAIWISPYSWSIRANWWRPWQPYGYFLFYERCAPHRLLFRPVTNRRIIKAHEYYFPLKHSSTLVVHDRKGTTILHYNTRSVKARTIRKVRNPVKNIPVRTNSIKGSKIRSLKSIK